jgi:hypothetical protein
MDFHETINQVKQLAREGEDKKVLKMLLLLDLFESPLVWTQYYLTWNDLLKKEGVCTPGLFNAFREASKILDRKELEEFGVRSSACLGRISPRALRELVVEDLRSWREAHKVPPEYQRVRATIDKFVPQKTPVFKTKNSETLENLTVETLLQHINLLRRMLLQKGVEPPALVL